MKTTMFASLLLASALCAAPAFAGDPEGGAPAAESKETGVSAEAQGKAAQDALAEKHKEFFELQKEIRAARKEAAKFDDVKAVQEKIDALSPEADADEIRKLRAEARTLAEKHLAEQPGMTEKLARLKVLGEEFRKDLPAEARRKGKRLPKKDGDKPAAEGRKDGDKPAVEGRRDGDKPAVEGRRDGDKPAAGVRKDGDKPGRRSAEG